MIQLLIKEEGRDLLNDTSFGGLPVREAGSEPEWPKCLCGKELQYQGKIRTDIGYEMIFMYDCDECWGDGTVQVASAENVEFYHPKDASVALRKTEYGAKNVAVAQTDYNDAREEWQGRRRDVLGQLYGKPAWIQGDETPKCTCCNAKMRFVAQLEEGPDHTTAMNFGGGCGYLFDCPEGRTAKFIFQC